MNTFKIVISAIIMIYLIFFIANVLFPSFFPEEKIIEKINMQLDESKKELGLFKLDYATEYSKGISLTDKDFEAKDTVIEFQCNSPAHCCSEGTACNDKIQWTKKTIKFNSNLRPITSTRCSETQGIYFCKIYFGLVPAQAKISDFSYTNNFSYKDELKITATIINSGSVAENFAEMDSEVFIVFTENNEKKELSIKKVSGTTQSIEPNTEKTFENTVKLDSPGEYLIKTTVNGMDFGEITKEFIVNAFGEKNYFCITDKTREDIIIDPNTTGENMIVECQVRHYCYDCLYAFECKNAWQQENPEKQFELGTKDYTTELTRGTNCT